MTFLLFLLRVSLVLFSLPVFWIVCYSLQLASVVFATGILDCMLLSNWQVLFSLPVFWIVCYSPTGKCCFQVLLPVFWIVCYSPTGKCCFRYRYSGLYVTLQLASGYRYSGLYVTLQLASVATGILDCMLLSNWQVLFSLPVFWIVCYSPTGKCCFRYRYSGLYVTLQLASVVFATGILDCMLLSNWQVLFSLPVFWIVCYSPNWQVLFSLPVFWIVCYSPTGKCCFRYRYSGLYVTLQLASVVFATGILYSNWQVLFSLPVFWIVCYSLTGKCCFRYRYSGLYVTLQLASVVFATGILDCMLLSNWQVLFSLPVFWIVCYSPTGKCCFRYRYSGLYVTLQLASVVFATGILDCMLLSNWQVLFSLPVFWIVCYSPTGKCCFRYRYSGLYVTLQLASVVFATGILDCMLLSNWQVLFSLPVFWIVCYSPTGKCCFRYRYSGLYVTLQLASVVFATGILDCMLLSNWQVLFSLPVFWIVCYSLTGKCCFRYRYSGLYVTL